MKVHLQTDRLLLRNLEPEDAPGMFRLDSNPLVAKALYMEPVASVERSREIIEFVRAQYVRNGIGRWAVIRREDEAFLGWCGLKFNDEEAVNGRLHFHDLGYRLIPEYWGRGYATEAGLACRDYAFQQMGLPKLYAMAAEENLASRRVLAKLGFREVELYDRGSQPIYWLEQDAPV